MKKILFLLITFSLTTLANNLNEEHQHSHHQHHSHEGHMHEMLVDGKKLEVDPIRFDRFVAVSYTHLTLPTTERV